MSCKNHPDNDTYTTCVKCGTELCKQCAISFASGKYACLDCYDNIKKPKKDYSNDYRTEIFSLHSIKRIYRDLASKNELNPVCSNHPYRNAIYNCYKCGKYLCGDCAVKTGLFKHECYDCQNSNSPVINMTNRKDMEKLIETIKSSPHYVDRLSAAIILEKLQWRQKTDIDEIYTNIAKMEWYAIINYGDQALDPLIKFLYYDDNKNNIKNTITNILLNSTNGEKLIEPYLNNKKIRSEILDIIGNSGFVNLIDDVSKHIDDPDDMAIRKSAIRSYLKLLIKYWFNTPYPTRARGHFSGDRLIRYRSINRRIDEPFSLRFGALLDSTIDLYSISPFNASTGNNSIENGTILERIKDYLLLPFNKEVLSIRYESYRGYEYYKWIVLVAIEAAVTSVIEYHNKYPLDDQSEKQFSSILSELSIALLNQFKIDDDTKDIIIDILKIIKPYSYPILLNNLSNIDNDRNRGILLALSEMRDESSIPYVLRNISKDMPGEYAAKALGNIGEPAYESLVNLYRAGDVPEQIVALLGMGFYGFTWDKKTIQIPVDALKSETSVIRLKAAIALGFIKDPETVEPLKSYVKREKDDTVRSNMLWAVSEIKKGSSIDLYDKYIKKYRTLT